MSGSADVVHVVRNSQGEAEALVGFMFDISERKKTEEKLLSLQKGAGGAVLQGSVDQHRQPPQF